MRDFLFSHICVIIFISFKTILHPMSIFIINELLVLPFAKAITETKSIRRIFIKMILFEA